jgi:hypothetical protein
MVYDLLRQKVAAGRRAAPARFPPMQSKADCRIAAAFRCVTAAEIPGSRSFMQVSIAKMALTIIDLGQFGEVGALPTAPGRRQDANPFGGGAGST